jgi:hypothetical protein
MVAGIEHCQFRAAIEVLVPYTFVGTRLVECGGDEFVHPSSAGRDCRSTGPAVWVGPASANEVSVPARQGGWLNKEPSATGPRHES